MPANVEEKLRDLLMLLGFFPAGGESRINQDIIIAIGMGMKIQIEFNPPTHFFYLCDLFGSVPLKTLADENIPELEVEMLIGGSVYLMSRMNDNIHADRNIINIL